MKAKKIHDNPSPETLRGFTEEMPNCRITEYDNVNVQTRVTSRSAGSTYIATDDPSVTSSQTIPREEYDRIARMQDDYIRDRGMLVIDGFIGNAEGFETPARLVIEKANANIAGMQQKLYFARGDGEEPEFDWLYGTEHYEPAVGLYDPANPEVANRLQNPPGGKAKHTLLDEGERTWERRTKAEVEALTKQPITKMEVPTPSDIVRHRENQVIENMKIWLGRGRYKRELEMVNALIEAGHDPLNIAAAALKIARADEKQRPIAEIGEVKDERRKRETRPEPFGRRDRTAKGDGSRPRGNGSHEEGMVRLKLNKGKMHGVRPNEIVGTIAYHANIPGYTIGKIRIEDRVTFVDVAEDVVEQILKQNGNYRSGKEKFALTKTK